MEDSEAKAVGQKDSKAASRAHRLVPHSCLQDKLVACRQYRRVQFVCQEGMEEGDGRRLSRLLSVFRQVLWRTISSQGSIGTRWGYHRAVRRLGQACVH